MRGWIPHFIVYEMHHERIVGFGNVERGRMM
jgi:hypothetical protein